MDLTALGYVGINSARLEEWTGYATKLLGMQAVESGASCCRFRMDDRKQRLVIAKADHERLAYMGWEAADAAGLDRLAARLEDNGVAVRRATRAMADARCVADFIAFEDPDGNSLEVFVGQETTSDAFTPGRAISGFKTGPLGMGHVVMRVAEIDKLLPFYRDLLGFRVSDYGLSPYQLYFFHLNGRHHSFAMVGTGEKSIHHFMVELGELDDVGQGYDLALEEPDLVSYTLGRHTNDHVTSFYTTSPSGFLVEYGWNGLVIDPATWQPHQTFNGPSLWGHDRLKMSPEQRERFRLMRLDAAARGIRAPLVLSGHSSLDSAVAQE